ncbi:DUF4402 domain-containing protein [uncultured Christiangramia sp.]|uniref:DUF4402 domain-containing protein n=1 Tax=uncultured Christiangramia sp. TaxID=503836 RepID=UPI0026259AFC|nr:DUF4402 domain-containing protein [uncultured Christiangramia sp.]
MMKSNCVKILFSLIMLLSINVTVAQNSATATFTASVNIIEPITLTTTRNMHFADIDAQNGGQVILNTDDSRTATGGAILKKSGNATAANLQVKGQKGYSYSVQIPVQNVRITNGSSEIILKDFKTEIDSNTLNQDSQIIKVGATLDMQPGLDPGYYSTSTPIAVVVSYN